MERYGYDEDARAFGRADPRVDSRARSHRPVDRRPGWGWGRSDFNVSPESFGAHVPRGGSWNDAREFDAGLEASRRVAGWRTGEPWGAGTSTADLVTARELMTANPEAVALNATLADVARRMRDLDVGVIPVVEDADSSILSGVITDRDIVLRAAADDKDLKRTPVREAMSRGVTAVDEGATVRDVFTVMKRARVRRVPVVDTFGRLVGIIAQADLSVGYAGLNPDRELEIEEVLERISEPARPRPALARRYDGNGEFGRRVRHGWRTLKGAPRRWFDRGYDHGYDGGWR